MRLVTATGEDPSSSWHYRDADLNTGPLLEALAVVQAVHHPHLDTSWLTESGHGGLTVAVFGSVEAIDVPVLRRMQLHAGSALAIALDVDAWVSPAASTGGSTPVLTQQGWRAVAAAPPGPARQRLAGAGPQRRPAVAVRRTGGPAPKVVR